MAGPSVCCLPGALKNPIYLISSSFSILSHWILYFTFFEKKKTCINQQYIIYKGFTVVIQSLVTKQGVLREKEYKEAFFSLSYHTHIYTYTAYIDRESVVSRNLLVSLFISLQFFIVSLGSSLRSLLVFFLLIIISLVERHVELRHRCCA